jgi:catechol 2,3-dioxygenase-like lactoylglutathione lyase family enzyme
MSIEIKAINHICVVVKDQREAEKFYVDVLGLQRHPKVSSWFRLNDYATLHLVHIPEAEADDSLYHEIQHVALEVSNLTSVLSLLLSHHLAPFQMDFEGNTHNVSSKSDPLTFGIGTIFVRDPDGNLIEFIEVGHGIFKEG